MFEAPSKVSTNIDFCETVEQFTHYINIIQKNELIHATFYIAK